MLEVGLFFALLLVVLGIAVVSHYVRDKKEQKPPTHPDWPGVPLHKWPEARPEPRLATETVPYDASTASEPAAPAVLEGSA